MHKFTIFKANNGQWAWRFVAANGRSIAWSGETYHNKSDTIDGINSVKKNAPTAPIVEE